MPQIQLDEETFKTAQRRAAVGGYASVDEYVADMLSEPSLDTATDLDHLFTPEIIADLDRIASAVDAGGKAYTAEEADAELSIRRDAWIQENRK